MGKSKAKYSSVLSITPRALQSIQITFSLKQSNLTRKYRLGTRLLGLIVFSLLAFSWVNPDVFQLAEGTVQSEQYGQNINMLTPSFLSFVSIQNVYWNKSRKVRSCTKCFSLIIKKIKIYFNISVALRLLEIFNIAIRVEKYHWKKLTKLLVCFWYYDKIIPKAFYDVLLFSVTDGNRTLYTTN